MSILHNNETEKLLKVVKIWNIPEDRVTSCGLRVHSVLRYKLKT